MTERKAGTEAEHIGDLLRRSTEGDAWHGPALWEVLSGVDARQASARPIPGAHTIWEIVRHIGTWVSIVRRRLAGETIVDVADSVDWSVAGAGEEAWDADRRRLAAELDALRRETEALPDERLQERVAGHDESGRVAMYTVYVMLHGAVHHSLYHGGQIALVKKALTTTG